jgi:hypothetical protein
MPENLKDFFNAKASLTLGASAAMVLAFTTTLCSAFALPSALVALCLSTLFATVQMAYSEIDKATMKAVFGVICTLVIFHAARGGNMSLGDVEPAAPPTSITVPVSEVRGFDLFVQSAWAGSTNAASDRYYLWKVEDGKAIYTNSVGGVVTNEVPKKVFDQWKWTSGK